MAKPLCLFGDDTIFSSSKRPTYDELLAENAALRAELVCLKQKLNEIDTTETAQADTQEILPVAHIHKHSAPHEKISLFMSIFAGRTDVYARRFVNKRTGQAGYAPVCGNEWIRGVCEKPKVKCTKCPNRNLLPLTEEVIYRHLCGKDRHGEDVIGVYPMLPDETCRFLVADFDDASWQEDIAAFRNVCGQYGLNVAVERSRSGKGGHIWFFFEEAIPCALARRLGSGLLTAAMEQRHNLGFASYDRFLPNQDTMPAGGFGNLIALPLQGLARKSGNSEFVNESFISYPDQWAYLAALQRIPESVVKSLADKLTKGGELGVLAETEAALKPWENKPAVTAISKADFPPRVTLIRANGIYVPKQGCSENVLGRVKRLAAFKNSDFYKAQAMHLSTYGKPRVICTATETDEYICLPRGLESELLKLIKDAGTVARIDDRTEQGRTIKVDFLGELHTEQREAAEHLLAGNNGVLSAATAFGKTVTAASIIASRKVNTLILVHTQALMNQWKVSLEHFLSIDEPLPLPEQAKGRGRKKTPSLIGLLGGGKNNINGIIDIAIIGSLIDGGDAKPLVRNYGMVIADECHHVPASRFESVLKEITAKYVYGLSATPIRQDGHHPIIFQQCGPIRYRTDIKEQSRSRGLSHMLIPRFTKFRKPFTAPGNWQISDVYTALAESKSRNDLILNDISEALHGKRTPLILTERIDHSNILTSALSNAFPDISVFLLNGQGTAQEKQAVLHKLHTTPKDKPLAVVATGKYAGEGFDEPRLDTLFITMPVAWKGTVSQYTGRLHRVYEGKREVIVYDYVDIHIPVLERMYHKRLSAYSALGYSVKTSPAEPERKLGTIFNQHNFWPVFAQDMAEAHKEIQIFSPYISKGRITQMKIIFQSLIAKNVTIVVITRPPESFSETSRQKIADLIDNLINGGIRVILKEGLYQKYCVIDRRLVWYGNINLLAYGSSEETIMRFENLEIAEELVNLSF